MKKYRFRTREEFELIGRWNDDDGCPERWANDGQMNHYLGQEILASHCIALCESNDDFNMEGWVFSNHDYVVMEEEDDISKAKRLYPIGTKFYPAHVSAEYGRYCIVTNDKFSNSCGEITALTDEGYNYSESLKYGSTAYNRLVYHDGKWAEIIKESKAIPTHVKCIQRLNDAKIGKIYRVVNRSQCECENDVLYLWESSEFQPSTKEAYDSQSKNIDMKVVQEECKRRFPIECKFKSVGGTYESVLRDDHSTYSIHKNNQIYAHSGAGCLYKNGVYAELVSLPITLFPKDYPLYAYVGDPLPTIKTLIENVQSVNVNLRTKKQINKLKF